MKYVIYFRVSTEEQKNSRLGLEAQEKVCLDYVAKHNGKYVIFRDEAVSGGLRMEDRDQLMNAIESLEKGDIFLVSSRCRFGRDLFNTLLTEKLIQKKGARLVAINQDETGMDEMMSFIMRTQIDMMAQCERILISKRTKAALERKKARGERLGRVPYGFTLDDSKALVVSQNESETLRVMYGMRQNKLTFRQIADKLNSAGYQNRGSKGVATRWTHGATSRVYKNYELILKQGI